MVRIKADGDVTAYREEALSLIVAIRLALTKHRQRFVEEGVAIFAE